MKAFVDADVLIWNLRRHPEALRFVDELSHGEVELWTGAMQKAEVLFFMRPDEEAATRRLLGTLNTFPVDDAVVELGAQLFRAWRPSYGVGRADALLAASTILANGTLYTLNLRHFPMPEVSAVRPW